MGPWTSSARGSGARRLAGACALLLALAWGAQPAGATTLLQREADLRAVVERAIATADCFVDRHESAVWFRMMEPRLRRLVRDEQERLEVLTHVFCEAHRPGEVRLPPGLVMAIIDVESRFDRWAVSSAGAVGLMQVMPFWPEELGMRRHELTRVGPNIRMGAAIFRHYLAREKKDIGKALARYNGSVGRREYVDLVVDRWSRWNQADDLGLSLASSR
jgi:soluble lytic murein transglycosylase-like protein